MATPAPSPFARSLLFGYVGMFLYESDAPLAERRAAALSLDSTLLAELLGSEAIRELLDPEVLAEVEASLQRLAPDRHARDAEGAADLLRFLGDLTTAEAAARGVQRGVARTSWSPRGGPSAVRIGGEERWLPIEDAGRVRDALGAALPVGVPETFTEPVADPLGDLVLRYARTPRAVRRGRVRGAVRARGRRGRRGARPAGRRRAAGARRAAPTASLRPAAPMRTDPIEYCDAEVLRRLRRASLARLRAEVEPVEQRALGRFLPAWQGVQAAPGGERRGRMRRAPGAEDVLGVVEQLAGAPLPASALESLILPARLPGYTPALLDELTAAGEVTLDRVRPAGRHRRLARAWLRPTSPTCCCPNRSPTPWPPRCTGPCSPRWACPTWTPRPSAAVPCSSASSPSAPTRTLLDAGEQTPADDAVVAAVWDLVWAGLLTNDTLAPLRARLSGGGRSAPAHRTRRSPTRGRYAQLRAGRPAMPSRAGPPSVGGRWALTVGREADATRRAHARAEAFLERHGVLTRGALGTERVSGGFAGVYRVLRAMEDSGRARRGYVVEGLGAAQFAVPGAIDRLRALSRPDAPDGARSSVVLAAADPAQPYGAALAWPATVGETKHRPGRKAGALVVLVEGAPVLYVERGGRSLLSFSAHRDELVAAAHALAGAVHEGWLGSLAVERADGVGSLGSDLAEVLTEAGFRVTPKGLRLRA